MEANIAKKTGKAVPQWIGIAKKSGLQKHGEIVKFLKTDHGFTHGYANLVAHQALKSSTAHRDEADLVASQYAGPMAGLKPIIDKLIAPQRQGPGRPPGSLRQLQRHGLPPCAPGVARRR